MTEPFRQTRCVHCLRMHYPPAVEAISRGEEPCVWCGKDVAPVNDEGEYQAQLLLALIEFGPHHPIEGWEDLPIKDCEL